MTLNCLDIIDPWRETSNLQKRVYTKSKRKKRVPGEQKEENITEGMIDTDTHGWTSDAIALLLRIKRQFPNKTWKDIKNHHFLHRTEDALKAQWHRMEKANRKLLDNIADGVIASNTDRDLSISEVARGADLLDRINNTATSNRKDYRTLLKEKRKATYPERGDIASG